MKDLEGSTGNLARDLPAGSALCKRTVLPRTPSGSTVRLQETKPHNNQMVGRASIREKYIKKYSSFRRRMME